MNRTEAERPGFGPARACLRRFRSRRDRATCCPKRWPNCARSARRALKTFDDAGYGEVATPAFEYEETMRLAGIGRAENVYRVSDKDGKVLVARFDSTMPIARLAATRYHDAEPPLRFCYLQQRLPARSSRSAASRASSRRSEWS